MRTCPKCGTAYPDDVAYCHNDGTRITTLDTVGGDEGDPRIGQILGSYRILHLLGEGGMGSVYLAEHTRLGRRVALKLLHAEYAKDSAAIRRFFGEARAVNQINHEHIVEITDFIEDGEANYYIMELLQGVDLAQLQKREGILPVQRTLKILIQVTSALAAVHDAGIVHRDLKPENIFLIERGGLADFVKLLDFGVAKLMDPSGESLAKTKTGAIIGTPMYMSPEQLTGKPVDYRTDIYAMGVILYELVCGRRPYNIKSVGELVIKQMTETIPTPSKMTNLPHSVPRELEGLILQCLDTTPERRPQTMAEVEERLRAMAEGRAAVRPSRRATRKRPPVRLFVGLGVLALLGGGGFLAWKTMDIPAMLANVGATPTPAATPRQISLTLDSNPSQATVYHKGKPIGATPYMTNVDMSLQAEEYTFKLPGHVDYVEKVVANQDQKVLVTLKPNPTPTPVAKTGKRGGKRGGKSGKRGGKRAVPTPAAETPTPTPTPKKMGEKDIFDPFAD